MRKRSITGLVGAAALALSLVAAHGGGHTFEPSEDEFFLRYEGCGEGEDPYLSRFAGSDSGAGCGYLGGAPVVEVFHQLGDTVALQFDARDGLPVILDGTRNLTGSITIEGWSGLTQGIGQVVLEGDFTAMTSDGFKSLGSFSQETVVTGSAPATFELDVDIPDVVSELTATSLDLSLVVRGASIDSGVVAVEGASSFVLPVLIEVTEEV